MKNWILLLLLALCGCREPLLPSNRTQLNFPKRVVKAAETPVAFTYFADSTIGNKQWDERSFKEKTLSEIAEKTNTTALLISRNDSILFRWYDEDVSADSLLATFSLAKSMTSALVGIAIDEGFIKSIDEPVTNYLPDLPVSPDDTLRISHLLEMMSGYHSGEGKIFYSKNHLTTLRKLKIKSAPGEQFEYWSIVTQILGEVLTKAISPLSIAEYLEEKIWQPAGMASNLNWRLDQKNGTEKAFCCMEIMPEDLLRFGYLYLNNGFMNGQQLVPQQWVKQSTQLQSISPNGMGSTGMGYGYLFWLPTKEDHLFMARGYHGQYLLVNRKTKMMVVRMGTNRKKMGFFGWDDFLIKLISDY
jgi:CubicO group peptidase (beta-lactamase class C family)